MQLSETYFELRERELQQLIATVDFTCETSLILTLIEAGYTNTFNPCQRNQVCHRYYSTMSPVYNTTTLFGTIRAITSQTSVTCTEIQDGCEEGSGNDLGSGKLHLLLVKTEFEVIVEKVGFIFRAWL